MVDKNYVYVYLRDDMPPRTHEMVTPCADGYTVYIDASLDNEHRIKAYEHALEHIESGDFDVDNTYTAQEIEAKAHRILPEAVWKEELDRLRKERKKIKAALRRKERQIKFLQEQGYDLFLAAENKYLEPR